MAKSTIKRIHVNQHIIRRNKKEGRKDPPITIRTSKGTTRHQAVDILGPCRVVYSPDKPLNCGARLWIETIGDVKPRRLNG